MDDNFEFVDLESVLDKGFKGAIDRLSSYISETASDITSSVKDFHVILNGAKERHEHNTEIIHYLQEDLKRIEHDIEQRVLGQKVLSKKLRNIAKTRITENHEKDIEDEKEKQQNLMLAIDDLQEALEKRKEEKRKKWNAIVKAKAVFKNILNIYINFEEIGNHHRIKVVYFLDRNPNKDNYYVVFWNFRNTKWKVDSTKPTLKEEHLNLLNLDFTKYYNIRDIVTFVYEIRNIFSKHYFT